MEAAYIWCFRILYVAFLENPSDLHYDSCPAQREQYLFYDSCPAQRKHTLYFVVWYIFHDSCPANREHIYIYYDSCPAHWEHIYCNVMYSTTEIFTLFVKCRWKLSCILVQQEYAVSKLFCSDLPQTMTWSLSSWDPLLLHFYVDCYDCDLCQKSNLLWSYKHHRTPPHPPPPIRFVLLFLLVIMHPSG